MNFSDKTSQNYDLMIDWGKRLSREAPFFYKLFESNSVKSVLDVACGPGRHCIHFSQKGYRPIGVDANREMIKRARINAREAGCKIVFKTEDFLSLRKLKLSSIDAITCLGNSFSILRSEADATKFLKEAYRILNSRGIIILHLLNYISLYKKKELFEPIKSVATKEGENLFLKVFDLGPNRVKINLFNIFKKKGKWDYVVQQGDLYPWNKKEIDIILKRLGFKKIKYYGFVDFSKYKTTKSPNLIIVAKKN